MPTGRMPSGSPVSASPFAAALSVLGEKWALLAIREIVFGNRRFDQIARNTGASRDILTTRLRRLEQAGVIFRRRPGTATAFTGSSHPMSGLPRPAHLGMVPRVVGAPSGAAQGGRVCPSAVRS